MEWILSAEGKWKCLFSWIIVSLYHYTNAVILIEHNFIFERIIGVPSWLVNVMLRPPGGWQRSLPDPPWLRCGGGCSRWWWQHLDGPCAAATAGRYQFFLNGTQCGGGSGPPGFEGWKCENVSKEIGRCITKLSSCLRSMAKNVALIKICLFMVNKRKQR